MGCVRLLIRGFVGISVWCVCWGGEGWLGYGFGKLVVNVFLDKFKRK